MGHGWVTTFPDFYWGKNKKLFMGWKKDWGCCRRRGRHRGGQWAGGGTPGWFDLARKPFREENKSLHLFMKQSPCSTFPEIFWWKAPTLGGGIHGEGSGNRDFSMVHCLFVIYFSVARLDDVLRNGFVMEATFLAWEAHGKGKASLTRLPDRFQVIEWLGAGSGGSVWYVLQFSFSSTNDLITFLTYSSSKWEL